MAKTKRALKHSEYFAIPAFMILSKRTAHECAKVLGVSVRTFNDKVKGYSDFSAEQGRKLAEYLNVSQEQLFLI